MIYNRDFGIPWQPMAGLMRLLVRQAERVHRKSMQRDSETMTRDLIGWGQHFLPEHFKMPPSRMHRWLAEQFERHFPKRGVKLNVLAPRGSAKSTLATLAYPLREALEKREAYIWIISDTMSQAHAHLDNIKTELTSNDVIAGGYPEAFGKGNVWRSGGIVLRNGVTIEAFGTGQRLRGRRRREHRPTLILCDDLQNDGHITSAAAREHSRDWFYGTLLKAGNVKTNVVNLATALHREAIGLELTKRPGWVSQLFRAIETWPDNMSLWETWESLYANCDNPNADAEADAFYRANREMLHEGACVLWPEAEDLLTLMKMRVEGGRTAFEREKQNSPVNPDDCEWPESYFDESIWFERAPAETRLRTMALDPSKGHDASRGDFSAYVMLELDANGVFYVDADLARRPVPEIIDTGVEHFKTFRPDLFGVEANQFQQLLCDEFERVFAEHGLPHVLPYPIMNKTNKIVRIRRLGQLLAKRRLRFRSNSPSTRLLVDQLKTFPLGDHDDGPDALEMAVRLAEMMTE
ncbi:MAG: hypothetical protein FWC50_02615 [Planctomycetaceae bacterium]|nr:hypothetical protein [Planctomycetaceae bacterium]